MTDSPVIKSSDGKYRVGGRAATAHSWNSERAAEHAIEVWEEGYKQGRREKAREIADAIYEH